MGRWQRNRDLSWYAKSDKSEAAQSAADPRAEEIKRIKEAEQDALSEALGYPVMPKPKFLEKVEATDIERAIKETADHEDENAKGVGFGGVTGLAAAESRADSEMMPGQVGSKGGLDGPARTALTRDRRKRSRSRNRDREWDRRRRSRSRDRDRHRKHRRHENDEKPSYRRQRSRSKSVERRRHSERAYKSRRDRSYSPQRRRDRSWERSRGKDYDRER